MCALLYKPLQRLQYISRHIMSSSKPTVYISSPTGDQGGAVARQLRAIDWNVHGTVRDPESAAAKALQSSGVKLTKGSWDDHDAIRTSIAGCDKVFLCLLPAQGDPRKEVERAENIVKIAKDAGVKQVVASTSLGVTLFERKEHIEPGSFFEAHLGSKKDVEKAVENGGFQSTTMLRPALMMANFIPPKNVRPPYTAIKEKSVYTTPLTPESKAAYLDHEDLAKVAVEAFKDPAALNGKAIGMASELLTAQEAMDQLGAAAGRSIKAAFLSDEDIKAQGVNNQLWMRYMSDYVDLDELSKIVKLTTFKEFLEREKEATKEA